MGGDSQENPLLNGIEDDYGHVMVDLMEPMTTEDFSQNLRDALVQWRSQRKKAIWIKMADWLNNLIAPAEAQGFQCLRANNVIMLTSWLEDSLSTLTANASHGIESKEGCKRDSFGVDGEAPETLLLHGIADDYGGVTVNLTEPMTIEEFVPKLRASLVEWRNQGKKGIWIKLADGLDNLIAPAKAQGFECHHAEKEYTMLTTWLGELPSTLPANASHRIGVGALVLNNSKEVLVVQETCGYFKNIDYWKLPTGVIKEGEGIAAGAIREVKEETGIETEFVEVLAFRESHKSFSEKRKTDRMFLCELKTSSFEIKKDDCEILAAKWMPVGEYVDQPFHAKRGNEMFMLMANICLKRSEGSEYMGFSYVNSIASEKKSLYCSTVHANSLNEPDQASTSTST